MQIRNDFAEGVVSCCPLRAIRIRKKTVLIAPWKIVKEGEKAGRCGEGNGRQQQKGAAVIVPTIRSAGDGSWA